MDANVIISKLQEQSKYRHTKVKKREKKVSVKKMVLTKSEARKSKAKMKLLAEWEMSVMDRILMADFGVIGKRPVGRPKTPTPTKKIDFNKVKRAVIESEQDPKPFVRPPAVYSNIKSSYGIYEELAYENLKKSG